MVSAPTSVCVIGAGTMGRGIAQTALAAGHPVSLVDPAESQLTSAFDEIASRLTRRSPHIAADLHGRLGTYPSVDQVPSSPGTLVVEAVLESLETKVAVFEAAAGHFGDSCILATNTSSLSVTAIAAGTSLPRRVVGMHFFNPVPVMKLVEVVTGLQTDPAVADQVADLASSWGKQVARVRSAPGFIVNRVARGFYGEALRLLEEQAAPARTIDTVITAAGQFRMGPFELMDLIGNDVNAAVTRSVWTAFNFDPRFEPSRLQDELVAAGRYGRKRGQGFYSYLDDAAPTTPEATPAGAVPAAISMCGTDEQLETLLDRAGLASARRHGEDDDRTPHIALGDGSYVMVTRGPTAHEESTARGGAPVVVLDRCVDPAAATGVAVAASHQDALPAVAALLERAGITAYAIDDTPGLVVARTLAVIANEAWETAMHGVAEPQDIDLAMRLGTNYPIGPFEWTTRWGASVVLGILDHLWATYHDPRYRANRRLREAAGG